MPAERKPGYDMPYYDWSPLPTRPPLKWPNNARVALCVILSMDHYQWKPTNDFMNGGMPGSQPEWAYKAPESPGGVSGGGRPFPRRHRLLRPRVRPPGGHLPRLEDSG